MCVFYYRSVMLRHKSRHNVPKPSNWFSVDQYRACIGCFNGTVRFKQRTCNATQCIFNPTNFSYGQYKGIFCSVFIVLSCSISLYKLAMMSLPTASCISLHTSHPNPLADLSISHINASSMYAFDTHLKLNRTQLDEIESALFLQYRYDMICIRGTCLRSNVSCEDIKINNYTV
jgi:hypothetical protein